MDRDPQLFLQAFISPNKEYMQPPRWGPIGIKHHRGPALLDYFRQSCDTFHKRSRATGENRCEVSFTRKTALPSRRNLSALTPHQSRHERSHEYLDIVSAGAVQNHFYESEPTITPSLTVRYGPPVEES